MRERNGAWVVLVPALTLLLVAWTGPVQAETDDFLQAANGMLADYVPLIPDPPPPAPALEGPPSRLGLLGTPAMVVRCMPGYVTPFGVPKPYAWINRNLLLWGRVDGGTAPYTYEWDFGDGSPTATGAVGNTAYIYEHHAYVSAAPYTATLTVTDSLGETVSNTVELSVVTFLDDDHERRIRTNAAIQDGLRWLYLHQSANGSWDNTTHATGSAVAAFELQGHLPTNDPLADVYAEFVLDGLEYIFGRLQVYPISVQPAGDPDTNTNGIGIYAVDGNGAYSHGIIMLALAASRNPTGMAANGPPGVGGETYEKILRDMVDQLAFSQTDSGSQRGGWRYSVTTSSYGSDNSAVQWAAIGLAAAETPKNLFSITIPQWVKDELLVWLNLSSCTGGSWGYTGANYYCGMPTTGSGLFTLLWLEDHVSGTPLSARTQAAVDFLDTYWCNSSVGSRTGQFYGNFYALYAIKKPFDDYDLDLSVRDWRADYSDHLVKARTMPCGSNSYHQNTDTNNALNDGNWNFSCNWVSGTMRTSFALLVLIPNPVGCDIVCDDFTVVPGTVCPGQEVCFAAPDSVVYTSCPDRYLVAWKWDFDASDGVDFAFPDAVGQMACNPDGYALPPGVDEGTFTVTLRTYDSEGDSCQSTQDVTVTAIGNVAPVACLNGPFTACVGDTIFLDACCSFDPNEGLECSVSGDSIVAYRWDLDGDDIDDYVGDTCIPDTSLVFNVETVRQIRLNVVDTFGAVSERADATLAWSSFQDVSVSANDIVLLPPTNCGDPVDISATARVLIEGGAPPIESLLVRAYYDQRDLGHRICEQTFHDLMAGDSATLQCSWTFPDSVEHEIIVCADPDGAIRECVETDNCASKTLYECAPAPPCPRSAGFWKQQCHCPDGEGGRVKFACDEMMLVTACIDGMSAFFDWPLDPENPASRLGDFCDSIDPSRPMTERKQAKRQFAALLANVCVGQLGIEANNGNIVALPPGTPVSGVCADAIGAETVGDVMAYAELELAELESMDLSDPAVKERYGIVITCLDRLNNGYDIPFDPQACVADGNSVDEAFGDRELLPGSSVDVPSGDNAVQSDIALMRPMPNPFTQSTRLAYAVRSESGEKVEIAVYNAAGRRVTTLVDAVQPQGTHVVTWYGHDGHGQRVAAGIYFYRVRVGDEVAVRRVALLR